MVLGIFVIYFFGVFVLNVGFWGCLDFLFDFFLYWGGGEVVREFEC